MNGTYFRMLLALLAGLVALPSITWAQDKEETTSKRELSKATRKGLDWLAKTQAADGHWDGQGGQYPTAMTALAGMTMLMEGSTLRQGRYSDNLVKAVDWLDKRAMLNGLIGNPNNSAEMQRYTYGHGYSLMFLASVYGDEDDKERRKRLETILKKAVEFTANAQTDQGGWGYVSAKEGNNFDEGSTTITQLQALRAARNAGIPVKKEVIDKATEYLKKATTERGGVIYSISNGGMARNGQERPALTAAAVACAFSAGQYQDEYAKKWIQFCKENIPIAKGRLAHDEYQSYYLAQAVYVLGDDRYGKMFPKEPKANWLTWSDYTDAMYPYLLKQQNADGSWSGSYIGPVYGTAVNLTILQLEKGLVPIYHR